MSHTQIALSVLQAIAGLLAPIDPCMETIANVLDLVTNVLSLAVMAKAVRAARRPPPS